ncbi:nitrogen regulation protein NR(II) [Methylohalobius crimeensis]|uniref:nitrogen regulation protein NR(II) n=1 Tax=Methylohalobius crimeensis TaxID=244365 RepID=UPI0003B2FC3C|nr:nitrogen regulation protein NR(II) [Methylohalobius crimeensis]
MNNQTIHREDEPLHQRILEHLGNAVLLFDRTQHLRYLNPAGEMLLAISARQSLGLPASALFGPQGEKFAGDLAHTIRSGSPRVERNLPLHLPGRILPVHCAMTPLFQDEQVDAVVMEIEDVERYQQLSRDERWLAQQNVVHQLLRGLAHEIKNPLGGLRGAAQLLATEVTDPALSEYTDVIIAEADRLKALIDRLLAPNQPPRMIELNIHQILERVSQVLAAEYPTLAFRRDYDPSLPPIHGDPDQLIQAFLNIARNAAQALEGDGEITLRTRIKRRVTIRQQHHRQAVRIDIIDAGPGIAPELLDQIFYPMITSRPDGTGLGLSIAQTLVTRHGGMIECQSQPGRTCFSIYLPLENRHAQ